MLCGGDEFARSQRGNNNCYCQDNELTWYDWNLDEPRKRLLDFTSKLIQLRKDHPNLHRRKFFQDSQIRGSVVRDCAWFGTDGNELSDQVWNEPWSKTVAIMLNGGTLNQYDDEGQKVVDDSFLIVINAADQGVEYTLPEPPNKNPWRQIMDTENVEDPFAEASTTDNKAIVGGRAVRLYSDSIEASAKTPAKQRPSRTL